MKIPLTVPYLGKEEKRAVAKVLDSGWLVQGQRVAEFEDRFSNYTGAKYAVATSSCTTALHLALVLDGIGPGDEVICPSYTYVATANAILYAGAKPVLVDIDPDTFNIDPQKIEEAVTKKTKAILPVHQLGLPYEMRAITGIARRYDLAIIEDAACALGARYKNKRIGSLRNIACFSFHPRKAMTTGEGGMLSLPSKKLAERARRLRTHGASIYVLEQHKSKKPLFETYSELGYNYRMTDLQAAIGIEQLKKIDSILAKRLRLAKRYNKGLQMVQKVETPYVPSHMKATYQTYAIKLRPPLDRKCGQLLKMLASVGIGARRGIPPIHLQPYWIRRFGKRRLPVTELVSQSSVFLPLYPSMKDRQQNFVIEQVKRVVRRLR